MPALRGLDQYVDANGWRPAYEAALPQARAHDVQVLAHGFDRMLEMQAPHRFDRDFVADTEAED